MARLRFEDADLTVEAEETATGKVNLIIRSGSVVVLACIHPTEVLDLAHLLERIAVAASRNVREVR